MDGNRTWAKERWFPAFEWHRRGYENAKKIIRETKNLGIPFASFWALSDDNIKKRSPEEIEYLFRLLEKWILDIAKDADKDNIRIVCIGDRMLLPETCRNNMKKAEKMTENNTAMTAIIAIWYWWQEELVRAIHSLASTQKSMEAITIEDIARYIETSKFPPPDMVVRTGWHVRHSWFYLFHSPYAEYFFSEKNWPDFSKEDILHILDEYSQRKRKYGE
jgi:undecaprenyl diphosphate synthase